MTPALPEFVYLITIEGEWPVSAVAGDHPSTADLIGAEIKRRTSGQNPRSTTHARIWRIPVTEATELRLVPERRVQATLEVKI